MAVRALVFDAYGTLYDVQSVRSVAMQLCGARGELLTQLWRLKQLEYTWLRSLLQQYEDFWSVTRAALEFSLASVGIEPVAALCDPLMNSYLNLALYSEAEQALAALKDYRLAILSNGTDRMLAALVDASAIGARFSAILSVDRVKCYKPAPSCYALVEPALGVAREEVLFISSNGFDVAGAKRYGFQVAWIDRGSNAAAPTDSAIGPSEFYRLLRGGSEQLGFEPDYRLSRLTDLPGLLRR